MKPKYVCILLIVVNNIFKYFISKYNNYQKNSLLDKKEIIYVLNNEYTILY